MKNKYQFIFYNKLIINFLSYFKTLSKLFVFGISIILAASVSGQVINEKTIRIHNPVNKTVIEINLPPSQDFLSRNKRKTLLIFYALPNGNSIEWTKGKITTAEDDWHFDIQQIAAQTRYIRKVMSDQNIVVVYLSNELKSWPAWKKQQPDGPKEIKRIVDSITGMFEAFHPDIMLNSHSGGGSFVFGYLDAVPSIPKQIKRIAFIDSDYGYEDSLHAGKFIHWLKSGKHYLDVLAYNDSVVIFNGKPLVSPTGGTWYRSKMMQRELAKSFRFTVQEDTSFINYNSLSNRINIYLKTNSQGKIYHTEQVARNGFIHTVLSGTRYQEKANYKYWGDRVYSDFILPE